MTASHSSPSWMEVDNLLLRGDAAGVEEVTVAEDDDGEAWARAREVGEGGVTALLQLLTTRYRQQAESRDCLSAAGSNDPLLGLGTRLASSRTLAQVHSAIPSLIRPSNLTLCRNARPPTHHGRPRMHQ